MYIGNHPEVEVPSILTKEEINLYVNAYINRYITPSKEVKTQFDFREHFQDVKFGTYDNSDLIDWNPGNDSQKKTDPRVPQNLQIPQNEGRIGRTKMTQPGTGYRLNCPKCGATHWRDSKPRVPANEKTTQQKQRNRQHHLRNVPIHQCAQRG